MTGSAMDGLSFNDDWHDELAQQLNERRPNNRHDIWLWLWLYLYRDEQTNLDPASCNGRTMRDEIARCLKDKLLLRARIPSLKDKFLVPDAKLKWIDGGERQHQWLLREFEGITDLRPPQEPSKDLAHLTDRNRFIAMLDLWDVDLTVKTAAIEDLRDAWCKHKVKDRDFEWFKDKKDGTKRCQCAWEWLKKKNKFLFKNQPPFNNYTELLMYFDGIELRPDEQKFILQQIKNRWSRKRHDEDMVAAGKKQVNVELSKTVIRLLDELAEKHQLARAQVVERLITMESGTGVYLADSLKTT
ncbi:hypothetical protein QN375_24775 [Pseudomonas sp. MH9.2]|uniref:hypothetical protein n=1 Tax=unclassified Pseudomonas TaxID=196821 RepID=UPI002AC90534|nr:MULTISPECIES: hypothetical protein [unclassified Pseudomonas]MEB0028942.1 hypothetical protein [Pseudomonas sp. MH9.2]MEB0120918.1 hypothetical protein [Pseudomonas sp. CCI1.2]WPX67786.1 hypothetical protein RHM55_18770 [Pseudomonas sp. MH9.2]